MPFKEVRYRRAVALIVTLVGLVAAVSYGVAQTNIVTQAEWAVYMVRALELDWSLPPNPKSTHYIERLNWGSSINFSAVQLLEGSSPSLRVSEEEAPGFVQAELAAGEAFYRVNTHRPGEYAFRVKLAGGGGVVKVGESVFEVFQPEEDFRWVDLSKLALNPGQHSVSLLLSEGTRAQEIGITPPCLVAVEPSDGWNPLDPLNYEDLAVTVAKALDLEYGLPEIGPAITLKGEDFTPTLRVPLEGEGLPQEPPDPFWLSSGDSVLTAQVEFTVPEKGFFTLEARYLSPNSVRWALNGCLRAITCPQVAQRGLRLNKLVALELDAGIHTLEVTLPPNASLDKVVLQQRDPAIDEYLAIVSDEGVRVGNAQEGVSRRRAIAAALRLRSMFQRWAGALCDDSILAMERIGGLLSAMNRGASGTEAGAGGAGSTSAGLAGGDSATPSGASGDNPLFPVDTSSAPPVASPVAPQ